MAVENLVGTEVASGWSDPEDKPVRHRVRVVRTDFKYPLLRLTERVRKDTRTGEAVAEVTQRMVASHVLVGALEGTAGEELAKGIEAAGLEVMEVESDRLMVLVPDPTRVDALPEAIDRISGIPGVGYVEPDILISAALLPDDPAFQQQRMRSLLDPATGGVDADRAWGVRTDAGGVVVAVTDTGIRYDHEDLAENMWRNPVEVPGDGIDNDGNGVVDDLFGFDAYQNDGDPMDVHGHGTHCAGTIGARGDNGKGLAGVAWKTALLAGRFLGPSGFGTSSDAVKVIDYSRVNGADLINASWGSPTFSRAIYDAIARCHQAGIPFVAAAGNVGRNTDAVPYYPAAYDLPNIVSVAATGPDNQLVGFSNRGYYTIDLAAPGQGIWSTESASTGAYGYRTGTSMAAPHVAGALALAMAFHPGESGEERISRLFSSVDPLPALEGRVMTGGRLNVYRLLTGSDPGWGNDDFADAFELVSGYGRWSGSNGRATREADEDDFALPGTGSRSVWFRWTASVDGVSDFTALADVGTLRVLAFEGSGRADLELIGDSADGGGGSLRFMARQGVTYHFAVDSHWPAAQLVRVGFETRPVNDLISEATPVESLPFQVQGSNRGATRETWESEPMAGAGGGRTVWWKWTAGSPVDLFLSTAGSDFDTVLGVFEDHEGSWREIVSNDDANPYDWTSRIRLQAVAGKTYWFGVDGYGGTLGGEIRLAGLAAGSILITDQPQSLIAGEGQRVEFEVTASSTESLGYQWLFNDEAIPGANGRKLLLPWITRADYGNYRVEVSNSTTSVSSDVAVLEERRTPPAILWSSPSQVVTNGSRVVLGTRVKGSDPITVQWFKDDEPLAGETDLYLELADIGLSGTGIYHLEATNDQGSARTPAIQVKVTESPWAARVSLNPASPGGSIIEILRHAGLWLALSSSNSIHEVRYSEDGEFWENVPLPDSRSFSPMSLVSGGGIAMIAGDGSGPPWVYRSTDGKSWEKVPVILSGVTFNPFSGLRDLTWFDGRFYAFAFSGASLLSSADGEVWRREHQGEFLAGNRMLKGPTGLLIWNVDASGTRPWLLPPGGVWQRAALVPDAFERLGNGVWHNGRYLITSYLKRWTSTDAVTWTSEATTDTNGLPNKIWAAGTKLIAIFGNGYSESADGIVWTALNSPAGGVVRALHYEPDGIVVGTTNGLLIKAPSFEAVTLPTLGLTGGFAGGASGAGHAAGRTFVAGTTGTGASVMISDDGISWKTQRALNSSNLSGFFPLDGVFAFSKWWFPTQGSASAFALRGELPFFVEPVSLTAHPGVVATNFAAHGGSLAALIARPPGYYDLELWVSHDGIGWTPTGKVMARGERLLSCGPATLIGNEISWDLVNWANLGFYVGSAVYHEGSYVVRSSDNVFRSSVDGTNWNSTVAQSPPEGSLREMVSFNGAIVGIHDFGISYAYDASEWTSVALGFKPVRLVTMPGALLVVGAKGEMMRFGSGTAPAPVVTLSGLSAGWHVLAGSPLAVSDSVSYPGAAGFARKRLRVDGGEVASSDNETASLGVDSLQHGHHVIEVEVTDSEGVKGRDYGVVTASAPAWQLAPATGNPFSLPGSGLRIGGGFFHAWGGGRFLVSHDGLAWDEVALPAGFLDLDRMIEGNGTLVATTTSKRLVFSRDGVNWSGVDLGLSAWTKFWGPYFFDGTFHLFTADKRLTSDDGQRWTSTAIVGGMPYSALEVLGNPGAVLMTLTDQGKLWLSSDGGLRWSQPPNVTRASFLDWNGQSFVIRDQKPGGMVMGSSVDGRSWNWGTIPAPGFTIKRVSRFYFNLSSGDSIISVSLDEWQWNPSSPGISGRSLFDGGDGFVYGVGGSPDRLRRSSDGVTWSIFASTPPGTPFAADGGIYSASLSGALHVLENESWSELATNRATLPQGLVPLALIGRDGILLHGNQAGAVYRSTNRGDSWAKVIETTSYGGFKSLVDSGTTFLARFNARQLVSSDGLGWTDATAAITAQNFKGLGGGDGRFLGIRSDNAVVESTNGIDWTPVAPAGSFPEPYVMSLQRTRGEWFAIGGPFTSSGYRLYRSPDGTAWTQVTIPTWNFSTIPRLLECPSGFLLTVGTISPGYFSTDLTAWNSVILPAVSTSGGSYGIVGGGAEDFIKIDGTTIHRSPDGLTWAPWRPLGMTVAGAAVAGGDVHLFTASGCFRMEDTDFAVRGVFPTRPVTNFGVGDTLTVAVDVAYQGRLPHPAMSRYELRLTRDGRFGNSDDIVLLREDVVLPALADGGVFRIELEKVLPEDIEPGDYALAVWFDSGRNIVESSESNNKLVSADRLVRIPGWSLTTRVQGEGDVTRDQLKRYYPHKAVVALSATGGKGFSFERWDGDDASAFNQISMTMDGDKLLTARFVEANVLNVIVKGSGSVLGQSPTGSYPVGGEVRLTAVPGPGWRFSHWQGEATGNDPELSFVLAGPSSLSAIFSQSLEDWRSLHFMSGGVVDPVASMDDADPDGDGVANWIEYLHGNSPLDRISKGIISTRIEGGRLVLTYTRNTGIAAGYGISPEASRHLSEWNSDGLVERVISSADGVEIIEASIAAANVPEGFLRLAYSRP